MGGTCWSESHYRQRAQRLQRRKRSAFGYDEDIRKGARRAKVHVDMDPSKLRHGVREARDSETHPNSTPIAVMFT